MALLSVTHKPITGQAKQFDGTLDAFLDIINARPKNGMQVTCRFDEAGAFTSLNLSWQGANVALGLNDWVVFPADTSQPPIGLTNAEALAAWQAT